MWSLSAKKKLLFFFLLYFFFLFLFFKSRTLPALQSKGSPAKCSTQSSPTSTGISVASSGHAEDLQTPAPGEVFCLILSSSRCSSTGSVAVGCAVFPFGSSSDMPRFALWFSLRHHNSLMQHFSQLRFWLYPLRGFYFWCLAKKSPN